MHCCLFLYVVVSTPLLLWYIFSPQSLLFRLVFTTSISAVLIAYLYRNRGIILGSLKRILLGRPELKLTTDGISVAQKGFVSNYTWNKVKDIEIVHHEEHNEVVQRLIVFRFNDARIFSVENDEEWRKIKAIKSWSKGILDEMSYKSDRYEANLFHILPGVILSEEGT